MINYTYTIGFIGCGNMGGALAKAVAKSDEKNTVAVCDFVEEKAKNLARQIGGKVLSAEELVKNCRFIVLGVKPQVLNEVVAPLKEAFAENKNAVIISMLAGVTTETILSAIGVSLPIIRIMPNLPAMLGEGMIVYAVNGVSGAKEWEFLRLFDKAGVLDKLPEQLIDAGTATSGSGPAYVYAFIEAMVSAGEEIGLSKDQATLFATQTVIGAGKMVAEFGDPESLRKAVCSPGGTTLAGLDAMEKVGFSESVKAGVKAAFERAKELNK